MAPPELPGPQAAAKSPVAFTVDNLQHHNRVTTETASQQHVAGESASSDKATVSSLSASNTHRPHKHDSLSGAPTFRESLHALSVDLEDGSRKINQYRLLRQIGKGSHATVHLGDYALEDGTRRLVAVKEFAKPRLRRKKFMEHRARLPLHEQLAIQSENDPLYLVRTEVAIMKKLHHPNVVQLYEVLDDPDGEAIYMVFEYCPDGPVCQVTPNEESPRLPEDVARSYFRQVLSGVDFLHENGIVHRDIKPDNILLTNNRQTCKIVDFGVSEMFVKPDDDTMKRNAGSPAFMSPELCKLGHAYSHGRSDDIWALGVTLYCMVMGRLPFFKENLLELYHDIQYVTPALEGISSSCCELLTRLLDKNESTRITVPELYKHPWVTFRDGELLPTSKELIVEPVTEEEVQCAVCRISSMFTVARAVSKFKRVGSRQSSSSSESVRSRDWRSPAQRTLSFDRCSSALTESNSYRAAADSPRYTSTSRINDVLTPLADVDLSRTPICASPVSSASGFTASEAEQPLGNSPRLFSNSLEPVSSHPNATDDPVSPSMTNVATPCPIPEHIRSASPKRAHSFNAYGNPPAQPPSTQPPPASSMPPTQDPLILSTSPS